MNKDSKNKECLNGGGSPALRVGVVRCSVNNPNYKIFKIKN